MPREGTLKVWWIPQVPLRAGDSAFETRVDSPKEAKKILDVLADYDIYQFENNIKPDYSNTGGLLVWQDGEWIDWEDELTGNTIDDWSCDGE